MGVAYGSICKLFMGLKVKSFTKATAPKYPTLGKHPLPSQCGKLFDVLLQGETYIAYEVFQKLPYMNNAKGGGGVSISISLPLVGL